jgi:hypothetical protein
MVQESILMVVVTSCTWEAMRPTGAEAGRRLWLPVAAFHDDIFRGVNNDEEGKWTMTRTHMFKKLL